MATIRVTGKFFPLLWFLFFVTPRASIDGGQEQQVPWRQPSDLQVPAGTHRLHMEYPYLIPRKAGPADLDVSVEEGQTVEVLYKPPWLSFMAGKLTVTG